MPATVLVAVDGSSRAERALTYALETFPDAAITAINVINPIDAAVDVEAGGLPVAEGWYENQIVVGSHGRSGIDRALLGSVAETVTRRARIPVTIVG